MLPVQSWYGECTKRYSFKMFCTRTKLAELVHVLQIFGTGRKTKEQRSSSNMAALITDWFILSPLPFVIKAFFTAMPRPCGNLSHRICLQRANVKNKQTCECKNLNIKIELQWPKMFRMPETPMSKRRTTRTVDGKIVVSYLADG